MEKLKDLNLTSEDFEMLIEGLEALPDRDSAGELLGDMVLLSLTKGDEEAKAAMEKDRNERKEKKEAERKVVLEKIKYLKGKLFMLEHYMKSNNMLKQTQ